MREEEEEEKEEEEEEEEEGGEDSNLSKLDGDSIVLWCYLFSLLLRCSRTSVGLLRRRQGSFKATHTSVREKNGTRKRKKNKKKNGALLLVVSREKTRSLALRTSHSFLARLFGTFFFCLKLEPRENQVLRKSVLFQLLTNSLPTSFLKRKFIHRRDDGNVLRMCARLNRHLNFIYLHRPCNRQNHS